MSVSPVTAFAEATDTVAQLVEGRAAGPVGCAAPVGDVPGAVALHLQTIDHLAHGWVLSQALGRKAMFDKITVEREIEFARGLVAQLPSGPAAPFAPSRPAPDDAPALDRLAALLGRDISE